MGITKADEKFSFVNKKGKKQKADFTNFELLQREVLHLKEIINLQSDILKENNIMQKVDPPLYDQEAVFTSLVAGLEESEDDEESGEEESDEDEESDDEDESEDDEESDDKED